MTDDILKATKPINMDINNSVISSLSKEEQFYVTLVSILNNELVDEQIITPTQKHQIEKYMMDKIKVE